MHDIEIYFVGGTSSTWTEVEEQTTEKLLKWIDDKENYETFKVNFSKHNTTTCLRKELILFINVI